MKLKPLSLILVASLCAVNAQPKPVPISSDDAVGVSESFSRIIGSQESNSKPLGKFKLEATSALAVAAVSGPGGSCAPTTTTKTVPTTITITPDGGGFNLFGGPKTVTTTVLSAPPPSTVTVTEPASFATSSVVATIVTAKTISVSASTAAVTNNYSGSTVIVSAAIATITVPAVTVTVKAGTVTETLPAATVTYTKGFFDGLFPSRPEESSSSSLAGSLPSAIISGSASSNKFSSSSPTITSTVRGSFPSNGGGLFGGRTVTFTTTEQVTTTVTVTTTEAFKFLPNTVAFTLPPGFSNLPKPTFPPIPGIPGNIESLFPGLKLPDFDISKIHGPSDILSFIESVIAEIEKKLPGNPLLGLIKFVIEEARKKEATKEMQLRVLLNIIAQIVKTVGHSPITPVPGLPPFGDNKVPGLPPFGDSKGVLDLGGNTPNPLDDILKNIIKGGKN